MIYATFSLAFLLSTFLNQHFLISLTHAFFKKNHFENILNESKTRNQPKFNDVIKKKKKNEKR